MKSFLKYFFLLLLLIAIPGTIWVISEKESEKVLSVASTPIESPSPTPTQTPTPTPVPSPTPSSTPVPSPTPPLPPPVSPQEIHAFIERFSAQYGVDPNVLRHIAICESGFDPLSVNGAYVGLYQFGPITWKNNRQAIGEDPSAELRFNVEESVQTAAYIISAGKGGVWPNCFP